MTEPQLAVGIHHVNFAISDLERSYEWYSKLFGVKSIDVSKWTPDTKALLMRGPDDKWHLHLNPTREVVRSDFFHFAIEVNDWDAFIKRCNDLGIEYANVRERPQDRSKTLQLRDPDGILVEVTHHEKFYDEND